MPNGKVAVVVVPDPELEDVRGMLVFIVKRDPGLADAH